jgi:hypothetical protein
LPVPCVPRDFTLPRLPLEPQRVLVAHSALANPFRDDQLLDLAPLQFLNAGDRVLAGARDASGLG